jgi:hypothetical protein
MIRFFLGLALVALATCGYFTGISLAARRFYRRTQASWNVPRLVWIGFVAAFGLLGLGASLSSVEAVYVIAVSADSSQQPLAIASGNTYVVGLVFITLGVFAVLMWSVVAYFASFRLPPRLRGKQTRKPATMSQKALSAALIIVGGISAGEVGTPLHSWQFGVLAGALTAAILLVATLYIART